MVKNTSFSLDEHYSAFIESEIASGRYRSASDVGPRGIEGVGVSWRELTAEGRTLVERIVARAQVGKPLRGG